MTLILSINIIESVDMILSCIFVILLFLNYFLNYRAHFDFSSATCISAFNFKFADFI